jgi:hypothetical protein
MMKKAVRSTALSLKQQSADETLILVDVSCLATGQYDAAVALQRPITCVSFSLIVSPISKGMTGMRIAPSEFVPRVGGSMPVAMTKI